MINGQDGNFWFSQILISTLQLIVKRCVNYHLYRILSECKKL